MTVHFSFKNLFLIIITMFWRVIKKINTYILFLEQGVERSNKWYKRVYAGKVDFPFSSWKQLLAAVRNFFKCIPTQ